MKGSADALGLSSQCVCVREREERLREEGTVGLHLEEKMAYIRGEE